MFVRKKKSPSGVISVQIIDKSNGRYNVRKTIGSSKDIFQVEQLVSQAYQWIKVHKGQQTIDSIDKEKFEEDSKWDGPKGYQTNDKSLSKEDLIENYQHLWKIEKAFRISKHDLTRNMQ